MSGIATDRLLGLLQTLFPLTPVSVVPKPAPADVIDNPWYTVAVIAFSASNRPDCIPRVFELVMKELEALSATHEEKQRVVLRMREALFKGGMISGFSRAISALTALYEVTPDELRDTKLVREVDTDGIQKMKTRGEETLIAMNGPTAADSVQSLFDTIYPDLGWFGKHIGCGHIFGETKVLGQLDTSYVLVSALVAMDTPRQLVWHLANCRRGGASYEQVCAVRTIAMHVASACGVQWREGAPPEPQKDM